jgi:hypothetical protein
MNSRVAANHEARKERVSSPSRIGFHAHAYLNAESATPGGLPLVKHQATDRSFKCVTLW